MNKRIKKKVYKYGDRGITPRRRRLLLKWYGNACHEKPISKKHKFHKWILKSIKYPDWTESRQLVEIKLECSLCHKKKFVYVDRDDAIALLGSIEKRFKMKSDDYMREYEIQGFRDYALLSKKGLEE